MEKRVFITLERANELAAQIYPGSPFVGVYEECIKFCIDNLNIKSLAPMRQLGDARFVDEEYWEGTSYVDENDSAYWIVTDNIVRTWSFLSAHNFGGPKPHKQYISQLGERVWEDSIRYLNVTTYHILFTTFFDHPSVVEVEVQKTLRGWHYALQRQYNPLLMKVSDRSHFDTPDPILTALTDLGFVEVPETIFSQLSIGNYWYLSAYEQYVNNDDFIKFVKDWAGYDGTPQIT